MTKILVLYTMKGCPWCDLMKKKLKEQKIKYINRDINIYKEEYDLFVKATKNDFIPAAMILENSETDPKPILLVPERDFNDIDEGVNLIKENLKK